MTRSRFARVLTALAAVAAVAACAPELMLTEPAEPGPPQFTEAQLRERAREDLALGLEQYQKGSYEEAVRSLTASLDHGMLSRSEQATARKHLAFMHCVGGREAACRDEFRKAMEIDPAFDLTPAEAGHPIWGPLYRGVRTQLIVLSAVPPKPVAPRTAAEKLLDAGLAKYDDGEYELAYKMLQGALKEGLSTKADRVKALKHSAFSLCLLRRTTACRAEFHKIFDLDPEFALAPAEAGHPAWAKIYAAARQRAQHTKDTAPGGTGARH